MEWGGCVEWITGGGLLRAKDCYSYYYYYFLLLLLLPLDVKDVFLLLRFCFLFCLRVSWREFKGERESGGSHCAFGGE